MSVTLYIALWVFLYKFTILFSFGFFIIMSLHLFSHYHDSASPLTWIYKIVVFFPLFIHCSYEPCLPFCLGFINLEITIIAFSLTYFFSAAVQLLLITWLVTILLYWSLETILQDQDFINDLVFFLYYTCLNIVVYTGIKSCSTINLHYINYFSIIAWFATTLLHSICIPYCCLNFLQTIIMLI